MSKHEELINETWAHLPAGEMTSLSDKQMLKLVNAYEDLLESFELACNSDNAHREAYDVLASDLKKEMNTVDHLTKLTKEQDLENQALKEDLREFLNNKNEYDIQNEDEIISLRAENGRLKHINPIVDECERLRAVNVELVADANNTRIVMDKLIKDKDALVEEVSLLRNANEELVEVLRVALAFCSLEATWRPTLERALAKHGGGK